MIKMSKEKVARLTIAFTQDQRRKLMILASNEGKCVAHYIKDILTHYIDKLKGV